MPTSGELKRKYIRQYVLPALGVPSTALAALSSPLADRVRMQTAIRLQELEYPGPANEGRLWFAVQSVVHSFSYDPRNRSRYGTQIWEKRMFVFSGSGLLHNQPRTDYIQVLEPGVVLSISYAELLHLMERSKDVERAINLLVVNNERHYHHRNLLLNMPPLERIKLFKKENPAFIQCSSQEIQAMHLNMSLRGYINKINKLKLPKR